MKILSILHAGSTTPLNACQFASYMDAYGSNLTFIDRRCFSADNISQLKGLIEVSMGVSVIYEGKPEDNVLTIREAVVNHVLKNKQQYTEEWAKCRQESRSSQNK
jgi:hypothetical protein